MATSRSWQELGPYLDRALELTGENRAAWLAAIRQQDAELAAQIHTLLDEHDALNDERFLEGRVPALPGEPATAGQGVGAYTLVSPIGYGGMGTVWLAERNDGRFERRAAVKFLNIAPLGRGEARFRREGRILGRLTHPNIAQLLDAGLTAGGQAYLILEHVDGEPIDQYCDRRALEVDVRIRLVLDVLGAVAHAHANLVVHRDIKPSNVMVAADGEVKLLDFGIARLLEDEADPPRTLTLTREGAGPFTPAYAAPEQLTGQAVTTATDVYALGALLYVLLTGQHPAGAFFGSPAALVRAITDIDPPRPSDIVAGKKTGAASVAVMAGRRGTTPERLRRTLRGDLDRIVGKALRKDPQQRYPSATALADDLRRYLAHQPVAARPDTLSYRVSKFIRRNRPAVALATLALIAVIGGATGTLVQAGRARVERDFALHQLSRAEALNDLNSFILSDAAPSGKPFTVNDLLARAERIVGRQRGGDAANPVDLLISIGMQYGNEDQDANSRRVLLEAYNRSRTLTDPSVRARASCAFGSELGATDDLPRAATLFRQGLQELPADPRFNVDRAFCLLRGADIARHAGRASEAVARVQAAQVLLDNSPVESDIQKLRVQMDLAESYRIAGQLRQANDAFARASALMGGLGRDDTETAGTLFNNWALVLDFLGRPREAENLFRRAIAISSAGDGEQAVSPMLLVNEARALRDLGHYPEAIDYAERGRANGLKAGANVVVNQSLLLLAGLYRFTGRIDLAQRTLTEVEARMRRDLPPGHLAFVAITMQRALIAQGLGDLSAAFAAADHATRVLENAVQRGDEGRDAVAPFLFTRSDIERQMGRAADATADATRGLALLQADTLPGTRSSTFGQACLTLGRALLAQGKSDAAVNAFRTAFAHLNDALGPDHPDTRTARDLAAQTAAHR